MKYLLDTCVISELKNINPNSSVVEWVNSHKEEDIYISVLTIAEIQKGITKLPDSQKKNILQEWLDNDLQQRFLGKILDINYEVASSWGKIQGKAEQHGKKMSVIDSLIAASGIVFDCTIVTRNVNDMEASGCKILNPWKQ